MKQQFDLKHGVKSKIFNIKDAVWYKEHRLNHSEWTKAVIKERKGHVNYIIGLESGKTMKVNANQLRHRQIEAEKDKDKLWYNVIVHIFNIPVKPVQSSSPAALLRTKANVAVVPDALHIIDGTSTGQSDDSGSGTDDAVPNTDDPISREDPDGTTNSSSDDTSTTLPLRRSTRIHKPVLRFPDEFKWSPVSYF